MLLLLTKSRMTLGSISQDQLGQADNTMGDKLGNDLCRTYLENTGDLVA